MNQPSAVREDPQSVPQVLTSDKDRHEEIASLNEKLNAVDRLSVANKAFRTYDINLSKNASAYLIEFDRAQNVANVRGYSNPSYGRDDLAKAERRGAGIDAVLVEVDRVKNLRAAYPNYFLDVREFTKRLRSIVGGTSPDSEEEKPRRVLRTYDLAVMMADYQRR
ncbi:hypothetical protein [Methylobacterium sp. WCS2018Hpa-22]|uniref:hypothetical protein n=1 Tax=Methylobacterium sp. WCS2018Hpa-22 TaxID=3073633 RepID=UPI00288BDC90|nr:hypothetical protein [Methylobacterium sp. WCS2018Hpa-22]